ncbi:hypothetical protein KIW84_066064 [Lathyrus oleraceus]|uniref:Uncharacterized protein n=1 Tax=Pisum sativum TaxID=3888 RepID=A0A9D5A872_PEA|nr:hypothetical protein KIW84_066064 [Pisum sativum]
MDSIDLKSITVETVLLLQEKINDEDDMDSCTYDVAAGGQLHSCRYASKEFLVSIVLSEREDQISSWRSMIKDIPGISCFEDMPAKFAALQKEALYSTQKEGEGTSRLKQLEVALDAAEIGKQNAETEAVLAKEKAEVLKSEIKQIELTLAVVTEERNKLRILAKLKNGEAGDESSSANPIQELESSLTKKDEYIKELESTLNELRVVNNHQLKAIHDRQTAGEHLFRTSNFAYL